MLQDSVWLFCCYCCFVARSFSVAFFYLVLVTNWLLSHAVRTLHSCPEEFFDLLPVVGNLPKNFPSKLITQVNTNFLFFLQIILFDSQEDDPELQHYCHRVSRIQTDSIIVCIVGSAVASSPDRVVRIRALAGEILFLGKTLFPLA